MFPSPFLPGNSLTKEPWESEWKGNPGAGVAVKCDVTLSCAIVEVSADCPGCNGLYEVKNEQSNLNFLVVRMFYYCYSKLQVSDTTATFSPLKPVYEMKGGGGR